LTDVEEQKRFEDQLRQAQRLESLGVLAGGVAHDFNNLLVGILGNASMALETISSSSPARLMLKDVVAASESAANLTRQLLAYAGKGRFLIEPLDISDLIRQIHSLIQTSIPKTVQVRLELAEKLPCVEGDASQLQQLIMNLVINGAEAIGDQPGTVLVTTGMQDIDEQYIQSVPMPDQIAPGRYVTLEVHDTGVGMTEETISRIFDPFFTTKFMGRGLGLAAALGIVRGHRGGIKVYSTLGRGSTFKVLFPAAAQEKSARPEQPGAERKSPGLEGVLVIDDEPIVRRTAKAMLERYGYAVYLAENGREGVDLFRALGRNVHAVLLDMTMPVMSGEETFRELKEISPDVPVILSSGYNEVEAIRRFTGKGLAGFVQKPYSAAALVEKVRTVIEEWRARAAGQ
ncbi:MAG TPA: response regulator, partial [Bryobacteraceae bacterium]|nr:response regulator [Bryobacteraceae bacterium]